MFDAVAMGKIKAIWIMATNPAVSMPDANAVRDALAYCPFVVVSDCIADTDTAAYALVKLPALGWGEKDGTVTNSERRISRQRGFLPAPGEAKPDWWALAETAKRMGHAQAFDYPSAASIFREYASQTGFENAGFENEGTRLLNISEHASISDGDYDLLEPFQWGGALPFSGGRFSTPEGKARMIAVRYQPRNDASRTYPLRLNTGRYRDQWHTMTRTGLSPKLSQHRREPLVEVHPDMIGRMGLSDGGLAVVATALGDSIFRVASSDNQRRMDLFVPIHWTDQTSGGGRAGKLPAQDRDPISGQPGFKNTPATIKPYTPKWSGFLIARDMPPIPKCAYWTRIRTAHGYLIEIAGDGDPSEMLDNLPSGDRAEMQDAARGIIRSAVIENGQLMAALFITREGSLPPRDWLIAQLGGALSSAAELLAGRPATPQADRGAIICVCFDIGLNTILASIRSDNLTTVEAVGAAINAGTNCGSCRPAIARMLVAQAA